MPIGRFLLNAFSIVLIDLLLAGDNALVIALAVRSLPVRQRRIGSVCGAAGAVLLRVALTFVAARILGREYVQLAGGLFIAWIALKVLLDVSSPPDAAAPAPTRLLQAIGYVVLADLTMSVDNILAIAGASQGHLGLIIFGLGVSIPLVIFSANLLCDLMDRYPALIYLGAAILGKVAGEMILTDPFVARMLRPSEAMRLALEGLLVAVLLVAGRWICRVRDRRAGGL